MDNKGLVLGELMIALSIMLILLAACTATTTIKDPDGRVYEIVSQKDAVVKASLNNGVSLTVDNRGERSTLGTIFDAWILKYMSDSEDGK